MNASRIDLWITRALHIAAIVMIITGASWALSLNYDLPVSITGPLKVGSNNTVVAGETAIAELPYTLDTTRSCGAEIKLSVTDAANIQGGNSFVLSATPEMVKDSYISTPGVFKILIKTDKKNAEGMASLEGSAEYSCADNPLFMSKLRYKGTFRIVK